MKNIIIRNGVIAGFVVTIMMIVSTALMYNDEQFEPSMAVGYIGMFIAFSFVFVGIKSYRDKYNHGSITFGQAFKIGLLITLIASTFYVVTWLVEYYVFIPDFMDRYSDFVSRQIERENLPLNEVQEKMAFLEKQKEWYKNPLFVILLTYSEILPIGIIVSVISALILKRKTQLSQANAM